MFQDFTQRAALTAAKLADRDDSGVAFAAPATGRRALLYSVIAAVSLAAAVSASVPALAQDKQTADVRVDYSDLDLTDPAAVRVLDRRLAQAVRASCPNDEQVRDLARLRPIVECRARKRAEIRSQRETALASAARQQNAFAAR